MMNVKKRIGVLFGTLGAVAMLALSACGPVDPVIGTGEASVMVTNDLGTAITSIELFSGQPEGFLTVLPTKDVQTIEPGQTVQVNYEEGQAAFPAPSVGAEDDEASVQPDSEETLLDEALGTDTSTDSATSATNPATTTSTTGLESEPIVGDAIRVVAGNKTLLFNGLDLTTYKEISLRTSSDGVNYVDYVDTNGQTGNTKAAATALLTQYQDAQKNGVADQTVKPEDNATPTDANAAASENGTTTNQNANTNTNTNANANANQSAVDPNNQGINGDGLGPDETGEESADDRYEGGFDPETGEGVYVDPNADGIEGDGKGPDE